MEALIDHPCVCVIREKTLSVLCGGGALTGWQTNRLLKILSHHDAGCVGQVMRVHAQ